MKDFFHWRGHPVRFRRGDTVATALWQHGVVDFGASTHAGAHSVFCGIGQCQACLVMDQDGVVFEACLHRPQAGAYLAGVMDGPLDAPLSARYRRSLEDLPVAAGSGLGEAGDE